MKKILSILILSFLLSCVLPSCSVLLAPRDVMMSVHRGQSKVEILQMLGRPDFRRFNEVGEEWEYHRSSLDNNVVVFIVAFEHGKVVRLDNFELETPPQPQIVQVGRSHRGYGEDDCHLRRRFLPEITGADFRALKSELNSFHCDDKYAELRSYAENYSFTSAQVVVLLKYFSFDDDKLKALEILAPSISNRRSVKKIINTFSFSSSKKQAARLLNYPLSY